MPFVLPFMAVTAVLASFANMGAMAVKIEILTAALQALSVVSLGIAIVAVVVCLQNRG